MRREMHYMEERWPMWDGPTQEEMEEYIRDHPEEFERLSRGQGW